MKMRSVRQVIKDDGLQAMLIGAGVSAEDAISFESDAHDLGGVAEAWDSGALHPMDANMVAAFARVPRSVRWFAVWNALEGCYGEDKKPEQSIVCWRTLSDSVIGWSSEMWAKRGDVWPPNFPSHPANPIAHKRHALRLRALVIPDWSKQANSAVQATMLMLEASAVGSCACGQDHETEFEVLIAKAIKATCYVAASEFGIDVSVAPKSNVERMLYGASMLKVSGLMSSLCPWDLALDASTLTGAPGGEA